MSKELIERLRDLDDQPVCIEAADRIEELEREIERKMSAAAFVLKESDAILADNARLREVIEKAAEEIRRCDYTPARSTLLVALAATPEQSLTSYRNSALEEAAKRCQNDESGRDGGWYFAEIIRDMKEPE